MNQLLSMLNSPIELKLYWLILIAFVYIVVHHFRNNKVCMFLDVYLNYIPVLTHEFGHILFNRIVGGRADDLVIVASPKERTETSQQGFAVTRSKGRLGQIFTTLGGYIMPPLMLYIGIYTISNQKPSLFIVGYLLLFVYFFLITSRKLLPFVIIMVLGIGLYLIFTGDQSFTISIIVTVACHYILGVLLGEIIQSTITIFKLTFVYREIEWDGSMLKALTHLPTIFFSTMWMLINIYTVWQLFA